MPSERIMVATAYIMCSKEHVVTEKRCNRKVERLLKQQKSCNKKVGRKQSCNQKGQVKRKKKKKKKKKKKLLSPGFNLGTKHSQVQRSTALPNVIMVYLSCL